jgi:hypothetical protein
MADFNASPISLAGSLASRFNAVEDAWFDKTKKDKMFTNWKRRLLNLDMNNKTISYYVDSEKSQFKGAVTLSEVGILFWYILRR